MPIGCGRDAGTCPSSSKNMPRCELLFVYLTSLAVHRYRWKTSRGCLIKSPPTLNMDSFLFSKAAYRMLLHGNWGLANYDIFVGDGGLWPWCIMYDPFTSICRYVCHSISMVIMLWIRMRIYHYWLLHLGSRSMQSSILYIYMEGWV